MQKENSASLGFVHAEENNQSQEIKKKRSAMDIVLWGVFYLLMYRIIFVEILNLDVFAMVK